MPIQKSKLDLPFRHGDDRIALPENITGLEGSHLSGWIAGECLTFNGNNSGDCLRGRNGRIHEMLFSNVIGWTHLGLSIYVNGA